MAGAAIGDVGIWNSHFRVGGAKDSSIETNCGDLSAPCAVFMPLHLAPSASIYLEDMWGWTADHDIDLDQTYGQYISTCRGAMNEAMNGVWLVGTAFEHNTLYQYNFADAENVFVRMQQCETPYWQGIGTGDLAPAPWAVNYTLIDPDFTNCEEGDALCRMAWYVLIQGGSNTYIYGSRFWSFFNDYGTCQGPNGACQTNAVGFTDDPLPTELFWWNLNTKSVINMVVEMGVPVANEGNNTGVGVALLLHFCCTQAPTLILVK